MRSVRHRNTIRPAHSWSGLISCCVLLAHASPAQDAFGDRQASGDTGGGDLRVEMNDHLVSLKAHNVHLRDVLAGIARQCDLTVVSHAALDASLTLEIERLPLPELLARIMRDQSYLLQQTPAATDGGMAGHACGGTLWIFSDGISGEDGHSLVDTTSTIEILQAKLMNDDSRVRIAAIKSLRRLDVNEVIAPLSYALADENRNIRVKAIYALADVGGDDAVAVLATAASDEDAWVRAETAYALGTLGSDTAVQVLQHALHDADRGVRESAIAAFTEIGGVQAAQALAVALQDADTSLRVEAVEALRGVGGITAIHLLNQALQDQDDAVREAARDALVELSD